MILDPDNGATVTIPDPAEYHRTETESKSEATLITGYRRYQKITTRVNIIMEWSYILPDDLDEILEYNRRDDPFKMTLDGKTYTKMVGFGPVTYERIKGTTEAYSCTWEVREP